MALHMTTMAGFLTEIVVSAEAPENVVVSEDPGAVVVAEILMMVIVVVVGVPEVRTAGLRVPEAVGMIG